MKRQRKLTRGESALLGLTALFLCALLGLFRQDLRTAAAPAAVKVTREAPQETVQPELTAPEPLDLNAAGVNELAGLPGIGEVLAGRIVAWREANGPSSSVEDLLAVSGIGTGRLAGLEGLVRVGGTESEEVGE